MYSIVVIDDERWIRKLIVKLLPKDSFPIEVVGEAEDGEAGAALVRRLKPHIVITDIRMPVLSGLELIERLKEIDSRSEIIIVSGYDNFEYARKAIQFGVRDYLLKPVEEAELRKAIGRAIKNIDTGRRSSGEKASMERIIKKLTTEPAKPGEGDFGSVRSDKIRAALAYIHGHFTEQICLDSICDHVLINPSYFSELFKKEVGRGFNQYLVGLRLERAKELLAGNPDLSIAEIARMLGFLDPNYFSRLFRKQVGRTAQEYRAAARGDGADQTQ